MTYATGCRCHGATFCPDLICIGYEDDVPVFVRRDSPAGLSAIATHAEAAEQHDRSEYARLRSKYDISECREVDRIMNMSEAELVAELAKDGKTLESNAAECREIFERAKAQADAALTAGKSP